MSLTLWKKRWKQSKAGASNLPKLIFEKHFIKLAKKLIKTSPEVESRLTNVLKSLQADPLVSSLKTHKLKGKLEGLYTCSLTYELRIIFELKENAVVLIDIGSHDEVY